MVAGYSLLFHRHPGEVDGNILGWKEKLASLDARLFRTRPPRRASDVSRGERVCFVWTTRDMLGLL